MGLKKHHKTGVVGFQWKEMFSLRSCRSSSVNFCWTFGRSQKSLLEHCCMHVWQSVWLRGALLTRSILQGLVEDILIASGRGIGNKNLSTLLRKIFVLWNGIITKNLVDTAFRHSHWDIPDCLVKLRLLLDSSRPCQHERRLKFITTFLW